MAYEPTTDRLAVDNLDARDDARPGDADAPDDARRQVELEKAAVVRDDTLRRLTDMGEGWLGVPPDAAFSLTTREAGLIERGATAGSVPFEYIFTSLGQQSGHLVLDTSLELGVTRLGKLSRIAVSAIHVRTLSSAAITRAPGDALRAFELEIQAENPKMLRHEITAAQVGFALPAGASSTALTSLALFVDYVVVYPGDGTTPAVSRRQPVSLSLIDSSPSVPREAPNGDADDPGDPRHEARPRR